MLRVEVLNLNDLINSSKTKGLSPEDSLTWIKIKRSINQITSDSRDTIQELMIKYNIKLDDGNQIDHTNTNSEDYINYSLALELYLKEKVELTVKEKLTLEALIILRDLNDFDSGIFDLLLQEFGNL